MKSNQECGKEKITENGFPLISKGRNREIKSDESPRLTVH